MTGRRRKARARHAEEILRNPALPAALDAALKRPTRRSVRAGIWAATGIGGRLGMQAADHVLADHERGDSRRSAVTVATIDLPNPGVQVRASLSRWGGREIAHLRTWFEGRDGRWRPTRRGITVPQELLEELERAVRALRQARDQSHGQPSEGA